MLLPDRKRRANHGRQTDVEPGASRDGLPQALSTYSSFSSRLMRLLAALECGDCRLRMAAHHHTTSDRGLDRRIRSADARLRYNQAAPRDMFTATARHCRIVAAELSDAHLWRG